jgi:hypothetical protein
MGTPLHTITGLRIVSLILTVVMLAGSVIGTHGSVHAADHQPPAICDHDDMPHGSPSDPAPCQHDEADGCSSCLNCACHAPLTVRPMQLGYRPLVSLQSSHEPFTYLPEVYLAKFVPPQNHD